MKNNQMIITVVLCLAVAAGGFFGGMKYQQSKAQAGGQNRGQGGGAGQGRGGNGFRPVTGEILSKDDKSITVKLQDGSSKIVLLPDSAVITKTDKASKDDLKVGIMVGVFGTDNSDGSVTAQNIQLNPMFRQRGQGSPSASPSQ